MKTGTGLALVAIGAILAFAITSQPSFINLQVAGWVLMLSGLAGMFVPRRGYGWLRRRMVFRRSPNGRVIRTEESQPYPPYIAINPAATTLDDVSTVRPGQRAGSEGDVPVGTIPAEETVDEFLEE